MGPLVEYGLMVSWEWMPGWGIEGDGLAICEGGYGAWWGIILDYVVVIIGECLFTNYNFFEVDFLCNDSCYFYVYYVILLYIISLKILSSARNALLG